MLVCCTARAGCPCRGRRAASTSMAGWRRGMPDALRACLVWLCGCAFALSASAAPPAQSGRAASALNPALKRVVSDNPPFVAYVPEGWALGHSSAGGTLSLRVSSPDGLSVAQTDFTDNRKARQDSEQVMARQLRELKLRHPDLQVRRAAVCKDRPASCAEASVSFEHRGAPALGRFFFHGDGQIATVRSYAAPAARLAQDRPLLLEVLTNLRVRELKPLAPPLVRRQAADGSLQLDLPADWTFLAQRGTVLAGAPQGGSGFVFTVFSVMPQGHGLALPPGVIVGPYEPPQSIVHDIFAKFGNRQTRVLAWQPDAQTAAQCLPQIGRRCDAADLQLSWVSPEGRACLGGFKVLNAQPNLAGQWFSIVAGVWGPAEDLARHLPLLQRVAASFAINDAYAKRYIEQGLAHLRQMEARTRQAVQDLYGAIEQNQRDYEGRAARKEASDAKWDDYARGNSYWVSDLEGGKVYQTDPWGTRDTASGARYDGPPYNYIHFEGQNPAHPSEHMREISSHELKQLQP